MAALKDPNFDFFFSSFCEADYLGNKLFSATDFFGGHKEHLSGFACVVFVFHILPMWSI